jgi:hypothetical protein
MSGFGRAKDGTERQPPRATVSVYPTCPVRSRGCHDGIQDTKVVLAEDLACLTGVASIDMIEAVIPRSIALRDSLFLTIHICAVPK